MLEEALLALASAGGAAVAQAAGTDVWAATRERVACLLGRRADTLAELDRTEDAVRAAAPEALGLVREAQALAWAAHFQEWLEALEGSDREWTASALGELRQPGLYVTGNTFDRSQVQFGSGNRQDIRIGPDA